MEILVDRARGVRTGVSTISSFYVNGVFECFCLEPKDRGLSSAMTLGIIADVKLAGKTAIPRGRYEMDWRYSPPHATWLPRILHVPGFDGEDIYVGDIPADTKGGLRLGTDRGPDEVLHGRAAVCGFYPKFEAAAELGKIFITIK